MAIDRRRREFYTARRLAREALMRAGAAAGPIPQGPSGEPCWPDGFIGSLTHCDGFVGAIVASVEVSRGLGIDAEPNEPLPPGALRMIAHRSEVAAVMSLREEHPKVFFDRLLFCIKEASYKIWFPLERAWLGFEDVEVEINARGGFTTYLRTRAHLSNIREIQGIWAARFGLLVCAAAVSPRE